MSGFSRRKNRQVFKIREKFIVDPETRYGALGCYVLPDGEDHALKYAMTRTALAERGVDYTSSAAPRAMAQAARETVLRDLEAHARGERPDAFNDFVFLE